MSYAGTADGSPVNVVCIHQHNDVMHDLVDSECELIVVAIQLVYIAMIIVCHVRQLCEASKLDDHHRHKPVGKECENENNSHRLPKTEVCFVLRKSYIRWRLTHLAYCGRQCQMDHHTYKSSGRCGGMAVLLLTSSLSAMSSRKCQLAWYGW